MLIYVIAGEPSGDLLGGRLMAALRGLGGGALRFAGIGGPAMQQQGLDSLFPMDELTVMGLVEVLPRLPNILRREKQTLAQIGRLQPDAIVTIDSWGFTGRIQRGCQKLYPHIPRIHYVAPMVWAWKPERAKKLAKVLDLLLTLLPFEPPFFEKEGLRTLHVGHSVVESGAERGNGAAFRRAHGLGAEQPLLVVLPGSRGSETSRLLPVMGQVIGVLHRCQPDLTIAIPLVSHLEQSIRHAAAQWPLPVIFVGQDDKYDCFAAGTVAMAASGTVALELAMAGLPSVILYKVSPLTAFLARHVLGFRAKWACLVNMVLDQPVMPEFLQEQCQPVPIAGQVQRLLHDVAERQSRRQQMAEAMRRLGYGTDCPGERAAQAILACIDPDTATK